MENRGCARGLFHSKGVVDFRIVFPHVAIMPVVDVIDVHAHVCVSCAHVCRTYLCAGRAQPRPHRMCMRVGGAWGIPVSLCGAPRKIYVQRPAPFRTCCLVVWVAMFGAAFEATALLGHPMNRHDFHCVWRFAMTHGFVGLSPGSSGRSPWQGRRTPYEARIPTESMFAVWERERERVTERGKNISMVQKISHQNVVSSELFLIGATIILNSIQEK